MPETQSSPSKTLSGKRDIYLAVTHTSHTLDNTGIQRVTRCLCRALEQHHPAANFVSWNESVKALTLLDANQAENLAAYFGPRNTKPKTDLTVTPKWISHLPIPRSYRRKIREAWRRKNAHFKFRKGGYLIVPEWVTGAQMHELIDFSRKHRLKSISIFHDAIAIDYPDLVSAKFRENHMAYLKAMTHCDLVIANSIDSFERFKRFVDEDGEARPYVDYVDLAGEIPGTPRNHEKQVVSSPIRALCVGSLDPRKNHKRLIQAFEQLWESDPHLDLELVLVGGQYDSGSELSAWVQEKVETHSKLLWLGRVSDEVLADEYAKCHFTCFPSLVEGFGIPLLESLWKARPCVCSDSGIVGVLASRGGCVTCNVRDVDSIAHAVRQLASDPSLYEALANEAVTIDIRDWNTYGRLIVETIESHFE
jgi:glycosyltransferase involved in cell wall biosynthesis